eukprot:86855-Chlamydomonas_euryale.AAC.1
MSNWREWKKGHQQSNNVQPEMAWDASFGRSLDGDVLDSVGCCWVGYAWVSCRCNCGEKAEELGLASRSNACSFGIVRWL